MYTVHVHATFFPDLFWVRMSAVCVDGKRQIRYGKLNVLVHKRKFNANKYAISAPIYVIDFCNTIKTQKQNWSVFVKPIIGRAKKKKTKKEATTTKFTFILYAEHNNK